MAYEIRPMTKEDVPAVYEVECICFRSPWSKTALYGELRNDVAHYHVLFEDGIVVGYAGMWVLFEEAHVTNIAVMPGSRRKGYGKALLLSMMAWAKELGASTMTLEVRETNLAAQNLYEKLDFIQNGFRRRYYEDTGEGALILWNMDFEKTLEKNGRNL